MAYNVENLTKLKHLKNLAVEVQNDRARIKSLEQTVEGIVSVGGEANVLEGVKVNDEVLNITEKMVNIVIATGATEGTVAVNGKDVAVNGYAALKAIVDALNGEGEGSIDERINAAFDDFAAKVSDDNVVNTYKELIDYAAEHGAEFTELVGKVTALENKIGEFPEGTTATTIVGYVQEAIAAIGIGDYAKTADVNTALAGKVDKAEGYRLMSDAEGTKLAGVAEGATKVENSATNGYVKINGVETKVYELPDDVLKTINVATDAEVAEMLAEVFPAE